MKKRMMFAVLFGLFFLLSACHSKITSQDLSKISLDMDQKKVESILGKPSIKTTDRDELSGEYDSNAMLYAAKIEFDDNEKDKNRGYEEYSEVFSALKEKKNVELYVYTINKKESIYVYFIDDKVAFFYYLNLNDYK